MDVYSGVSRGYSHKVLYVGGRRSAVAEAWKRSKPGDVLVLAGRGDEKAYITKEGVNLDFSDLNVLKEMGISCGVLEP
jgi:UDP-N-acetylmuramyl tripeptide synthase